jgi:hypothetical protein
MADGKTFRLGQIQNTQKAREYVAVSYSWQSMKSGTPDPPLYWIESPGQQLKENVVRNDVLFRAARYARHVNISHIWADCECIDPSSQAEAMNSMDLVYKRSRRPVGLMETVLDDMEEIKLLKELLYGELASIECNSTTLNAGCDEQKVKAVLALLQRLSQDHWWNRSWIFQEDYLGAPRMVILVPHDRRLSFELHDFARRESRYHPLWIIEDEICINASMFRCQATIFLLATRESKSNALRAYTTECEALLSVFGKYNILYRHDESARGRAMSSRIFSDLGKRRITEEYDFLAIAANACDYKLRCDVEKITLLEIGVGLCGLALYLRNGEIIANSRSDLSLPRRTSLSSYLKTISFNGFDPPVGDKELTWLKDCRLSNVTLSTKGIHTKGHLWRVFNRFEINWKRLPFSRSEDGTSGESMPDDVTCEDEWQQFKQWCLELLAGKLERAAENPRTGIKESRLPERLRFYVKTFGSSRNQTADMQHMDLMASEIVRAIADKQHQYLSLAVLEGSDDWACAIFVGDHTENPFVFTSLSDGKNEDEDGQHRTRHVSLTVQAETVQAETSGLSRTLKVTGWVNGLTFFDRSHVQEEEIFAWPEAWAKSSKRERPEDHDDDVLWVRSAQVPKVDAIE